MTPPSRNEPSSGIELPPEAVQRSASGTPLRRNIELKARVVDLSRVRVLARQLATRSLGVQHQLDTYFHCRSGRLKLREIRSDAGPSEAQLIWYARADQHDAKDSQYLLVPTTDPALLKQALTAAHGVRQVVEKRREILLYHHVRIHLDEVNGRGTFLEFEAVLGPALDAQTGKDQVEWLREQLEIEPTDLLAGSYGDMP